MAAKEPAMAAVFHNLHLLLLLLLVLTHNLVEADDSFIKHECAETEVAAACIQCIKSDPRGQKADTASGVATIILNCLSKHADTLVANMSSLAAFFSSDKNLKGICEDCKRCYLLANRDLSAATSDIKSGNYDNANKHVATALVNEHMVACKTSIDAHTSSFPDSVVYEMRIYEELSGAVMSIVDRLAYNKP